MPSNGDAHLGRERRVDDADVVAHGNDPLLRHFIGLAAERHVGSRAGPHGHLDRAAGWVNVSAKNEMDRAAYNSPPLLLVRTVSGTAM